MTILSLQAPFTRFRFALLFTLLLFSAGILFRGFLADTLNNAIQDNMTAEWAAMKGVLQIQNGTVSWMYDSGDADQTRAIGSLQRVFLLTDSRGSVIQESDNYAELGEDAPEEVQTAIRSPQPSWKIRRNTQGVSYLVRSGVIYSQDTPRSPYFVAIGRSLVDNRRIIDKFTGVYIGLIAIMIFAEWLLGRRDHQQSFPVA